MDARDDLDATIAEYAARDPQFLERLAQAEARLLAHGFGAAPPPAEQQEGPAADLLLTSAEAQAELGLPEEAVLALARSAKVRVLEPTPGEFFFEARGLRALGKRRAVKTRHAA